MTNFSRISGQALSLDNDALQAEAMARMLADLGWPDAQTCRSAGEAIETPPILVFAPGSVPPKSPRLAHVITKPVDPSVIHAILPQALKDLGLIGRMQPMLGNGP